MVNGEASGCSEDVWRGGELAWLVWDNGVGAICVATEANTCSSWQVADLYVVKGIVINTAMCGDFGGAPFAPYEGPPAVSRDGTKAGTPFLESQIPGILRGLPDFPVNLVAVAVVEQGANVVIDFTERGVGQCDPLVF